jgi:hypothetical protein
MSIDQFDDVIAYSLERDPSWIDAAKGALVDLKYDADDPLNKVAILRRKAFDLARIGDYTEASRVIQELADTCGDERLRGWLLQQLAEHTHPFDPVKAQELLGAAVKCNSDVLHPIEGTRYHKVDALRGEQARRVLEYISTRFPERRLLAVHVHALLDSLVFEPNTSEAFEKAFKEVAELLGHVSQRPDHDFGKGPDVLVEIGNGKFLVIECKNGATTDEISKHDCDQLSGSMNWFKQTYGQTCSAIPVMVHKVNLIGHQASPHRDTRIISDSKLRDLREAVRAFAVSVGSAEASDNAREVAKLLSKLDLTAELFCDRYTEAPRAAPSPGPRSKARK